MKTTIIVLAMLCTAPHLFRVGSGAAYDLRLRLGTYDPRSRPGAFDQTQQNNETNIVDCLHEPKSPTTPNSTISSLSLPAYRAITAFVENCCRPHPADSHGRGPANIEQSENQMIWDLNSDAPSGVLDGVPRLADQYSLRGSGTRRLTSPNNPTKRENCLDKFYPISSSSKSYFAKTVLTILKKTGDHRKAKAMEMFPVLNYTIIIDLFTIQNVFKI